MVNSHLNRWKITSLTLTQAILNIVKMKDFHDSQDYRAEQNYPIPKPKGIKVGIQFKECMQ
jgi:hypothetical protein